MTPLDPGPGKESGRPARQIAIALQLPFVLIGPVLIGGALGYFLDRWLHTSPLLLLVLGILGLGIGLRDALKIAGAGDK